MFQQAQALPAPLQQFLRLNPEGKKVEQIEIEVAAMDMDDDKKEAIAEAVVEEGNYLYIFRYFLIGIGRDKNPPSGTILAHIFSFIKVHQ